jgi:membrane protein
MDSRQGLARLRDVTGAVVREVRAENVTFMAGSIAYHAFVSLLPFLLLVLTVVSAAGDEELARRLLRAVAGYLTPETVELLVRTAFQATGDARISVVGLVVLVWGTLRIFRGLDQAFSDIYESESANTFLDQIRDGVVVFGAIGLALFLVSVADVFVSIPSFGPADPVVGPVVAVAGVAVALLPMYYVFPDEDVSVREVLPGAVVGAVGWVALSSVFRYYAAASSSTSYGIVGVVILLVTWLYFGGLALLVGASVNAVLAGRSEDVADIAWDAALDGDASANDAEFVAAVEALRDALDGDAGEDGARSDDGEIRVSVRGTEVVLPRPAEASAHTSTVERPRILGGNRETARVLLRWDSRADGRRG